jgi:hypothetical protein
MNTGGSPKITEPKTVTTVLPTVLKAAFVGLLAGYLVALWLSQWVWLEMRVNLGAVIPGGILIAVLLALWTRMSLPCSLMLALEVTLAVSFVAIYGWRRDALWSIPACLFREGCHVGLLGIDVINMMLGIFVLGANGGWLITECRRKASASS